MFKLKSKRELNIIRGKMMVNVATQQELQDFLTYVVSLEALLEEASNKGIFGDEGWENHINYGKS